MVNGIGRQCYHCKSFKSIFKRKANGKEYYKCGSCGKSFIYYVKQQVSANTKRQAAVADITKDK